MSKLYSLYHLQGLQIFFIYMYSYKVSLKLFPKDGQNYKSFTIVCSTELIGHNILSNVNTCLIYEIFLAQKLSF